MLEWLLAVSHAGSGAVVPTRSKSSNDRWCEAIE